MTSKSARSALFVVAFIALFGFTSFAQICPPEPFGFSGLNGASQGSVNNNGALLEFITGSNSTDVLNNDNTAEAYMGEAIAIQFTDTRVPAGSPFTLSYSIGVLPAPISAPTVVDGDIWLDINNGANVFAFIDGLALTNPVPDPLGVTPGPTNIVNLNVGVTVDPNALGACVTFQTLVSDPLAPAPFNISFSNPVLFGIAPGIRQMTPQIAPTGALVKMDIPGQAPAGELINFPGGSNSITNANQEAIVPADAVSGTVSGFINIWNTLPSDDGLNDYLVVTDSTIVPQAIPGTINLNVDPNLPIPGTSRASVTSGLGNATQTATFSVFLQAGDILDLEVFSTNLGNTQILDGLGNLINPLAQEGFDPQVTLQQTTNLDQLVWDGTTGPYNLISDDNSGPVNNARLRWQAKWTDNYNIVVSNADVNSFVTGGFLINLLVTPGAPSVRAFNFSGAPVSALNRVNIVQQGTPIDLICDNLIVGNTYTVDFIPKAGAPFTTRSVSGVLATSPTTLTVTVPTPGPTDLDMGLHQVRLFDEVTGQQGLIWDNSVFTTTVGILPDLLSIAGSNITAATNAAIPAGGVSIPVTALNAESIVFSPPAANAANLGAAFITATDPGGSSVMYAEALGLTENNQLLFDTFGDSDAVATGGANNGIYNPYIQSWPIALTNAGPFNDDDGVLPAALFPTPLGIGFNAAIIDQFFPLTNPGGGAYEFLLQELITFGNPANHGCIFNVVIK